MTAMKANRLVYAVWLPAAAALYFFENNTGTRAILAASILVPLISVFCAYRCSRRTVLSLDAPASGEKGAPLSCCLSASPLVFCEAYASLHLRNALTREETRAGAVAGVPLSLGISHCGLLTVSVDRADVRDVLGLCSFAVRADCARDTWAPPSCFPAQVAFEAFPAHAQEDSRFSAVRRGEDFSETQSIRPYVPGDPVRQIHWKLSAKTGQTLLREIGLPQTGGILLALAVDGAATPDAAEASLCGLLSASRALLEQGVAHRVSFWRRASLPVSSAEDWERAARMLSSTPPDPSAESGFERVAVFSPRADVDVSDACAHVTLVLPQDAQALVGDVPVVFFGAHAPFLTL